MPGWLENRSLTRKPMSSQSQDKMAYYRVRIRFWDPLYYHHRIIIVRNPQNRIGNYCGPYIKTGSMHLAMETVTCNRAISVAGRRMDWPLDRTSEASTAFRV